jgi:hypothetical protein
MLAGGRVCAGSWAREVSSWESSGEENASDGGRCEEETL